MRQPLDRITEAYYDGMGEIFGRKVRERIHWICSQAKGDRILDVGCSQGIISILLGREGKQVLGIDLIEDAIQYANKSLEEESSITKKHVIFIYANFMDYDFKENKFDSIILSEVLEHLTDPLRFLEKASSLLLKNGQIIITVPFGINNHFDHKKTYYLVDLITMIEKVLYVDKIHFFNKWIGIVAKSSGKKFEIDRDTILKFENMFYEIESGLNHEISVCKNNINSLNNKILEKEYEISKMTNINQDYQHKVEKLLNDIIDLKIELINNIESEEKSLRSYKELLANYNVLNNKYKIIKGSRLGRLTLWYWNFRKKLRGK